MMRPHTVDRFLHYRKTVGAHAALLAIAAKLRGTTVLHAVDRRELAHRLWLRIPSSDVDAYRQIFVDADYDFVADPPLRTIVDAGANIGLAAVSFANRYPTIHHDRSRAGAGKLSNACAERSAIPEYCSGPSCALEQE